MTDRNLDDPRTLVGTWTFSRDIDDRLTGTHNTVEGRTELTVVTDDEIRWHETGTLHLNGQELPVSRTLRIVRREGSWMVTFDDGREFHPWSPGNEVEHPCGADLYIGRIDLEPAVRTWNVRWDVSGPAKNYTMTTTLTELGPHTP